MRINVYFSKNHCKNKEFTITYPRINQVTRIYRFLHMIASVSFQVTQLHLFFNEWIVGTLYILLPEFPLKASIFNFSRGASVNMSFYFPLPLPPLLPRLLLLLQRLQRLKRLNGVGVRLAG